jgi:hypothetical protein
MQRQEMQHLGMLAPNLRLRLPVQHGSMRNLSWYRFAILKPTEFINHSTSLQFQLCQIKTKTIHFGCPRQTRHLHAVGKPLVFYLSDGDIKNFHLFRYKAVAVRKLNELLKLKCML